MEHDTLGARIAQARRELGIRLHRDVTAADLAVLMGVTPTTVYRWEADRKVPKRDALLRLGEVLGVRPAYLLFGQEPKQADTLSPAAELLQRLGIEPRGQDALTQEQVQELVDRSHGVTEPPLRRTAGKKRRR